jgi:hypothetical protein
MRIRTSAFAAKKSVVHGAKKTPAAGSFLRRVHDSYTHVDRQRSATTTASEASEAEEREGARSREREDRLTELNRGASDAAVVADAEVPRATVGASVNHELAEADVGRGVRTNANATLEIRRVRIEPADVEAARKIGAIPASW